MTRNEIMLGLRELRGNEDYTEIKPLIRKTLDYITELEQKMSDAKALARAIADK